MDKLQQQLLQLSVKNNNSPNAEKKELQKGKNDTQVSVSPIKGIQS